MHNAALEGERPKVVQLVANRAAGGHQVQRIAELAQAFERTGARVVISECGPHCDFPLDAEADHLCVIGGDGTIRHAALAAATAMHPVPISFYPAGTINLVHREAPCDLDPDAYARRIVGRDSERVHYAASLNDSLFLACASVGPDSAAVAQVSTRLKRRIGRLAYAVAFLRLLWRWPRHEIILCHDGKALKCEAFYVAKGRYFAGPWSFAPAARLDDPLLHVVAIKRCNRRSWLRFAWALYRETPVGNVPGVVCFTCTKLSAEAAVQLPVQADGDIAATLPVTIAIRPEPLRFC
jgi:diacylglycerol kinase family enzyme